MATHHERRVTIPKDLWDSIGYYVVDERLKLPKELQGSITHESAIIGILTDKMIEAKHYPPPPRNGDPGKTGVVLHTHPTGGGGVDQQ